MKLNQLLLALGNSYQFNTLGERLVAAYFMGHPAQDLVALFESQAPKLHKWADDDPVADSVWAENMMDYANDVRYQERFYNYFRDELTETPYWTAIVKKSEELVFEGLWQHDMRGLIHLGCATELDHAVMAMEALGMSAWAKPEHAKETPRGDLKSTLEKALYSGGVATRAAAAACQLIYGRGQSLSPRRLIDRLAVEVEELWQEEGTPHEAPDATNETEKRAKYVLTQCLKNVDRYGSV